MVGYCLVSHYRGYIPIGRGVKETVISNMSHMAVTLLFTEYGTPGTIIFARGGICELALDHNLLVASSFATPSTFAKKKKKDTWPSHKIRTLEKTPSVFQKRADEKTSKKELKISVCGRVCCLKARDIHGSDARAVSW